MAKLSIEKIKEELSSAGFSFKSGTYENLTSVLDIACKEGHVFPTTLKQVRTKKVKCPTCEGYDQAYEKEIKMATPSKKTGIRVLALDNATNKTGYSVFEGGKLLTHGVKATTQKDSISKIIELKNWLVGMIKLWEIDRIGVENVQLQDNPQTLILLSKLLGVLEVAGQEITQKPVMVVSSSTWKSFCGIKGKNRSQQKEDAQRFIKVKFGFVATQDASDAICLGLYVVNQATLDTMIDFRTL